MKRPLSIYARTVFEKTYLHASWWRLSGLSSAPFYLDLRCCFDPDHIWALVTRILVDHIPTTARSAAGGPFI